MDAHDSRSRFRHPSLTQLLITLSAALVLYSGFAEGTAKSSAQTDAGKKKEREIETRVAAHLPIKLKIKKPEKLKDAENEDWLSDLEIEVSNSGTKPIYHLYISLILPDVSTEDGKGVAYQLRYGRAQLSNFEEPVRPDDIPLMPGESTVIKLSEDRLKAWKSLRAKGKVANPKKLQFWFQWLNHGDGTGFAGPDGLPLPLVKSGVLIVRAKPGRKKGRAFT